MDTINFQKLIFFTFLKKMTMFIMNIFEENYTKYIQPLYGLERDEEKDLHFINENCVNRYKICRKDRVDLTHLQIYNIDPDHCEDVDDAFSIHTENNKLFLTIHIADPTEYISLDSELWKDIKRRITTKYPSNRRPIPLLPSSIVKKSSLCKNDDNDIKKAVSVSTEIDPNTFEPIGLSKILFSIVRVDSNNNYTYKRAALEKEKFETALKISHCMKQHRGKTTKLNDIHPLRYNFSENQIHFYEDTLDEKQMKEMIAEFAIFVNGFIGQYLEKHLEYGIFRSCDSKDLVNRMKNDSTGYDILQEIITNGISAEYVHKGQSHDLVGRNLYSHFTSPIRRLSDLICHYLLKYIYLKTVDLPFCREELIDLTNQCLTQTRKDKKLQNKDNKFRLLQVLYFLIKDRKQVTLEYYITSYTGLFLNIIISKFDEFNVHLSYTLRIPKSKKEYCVGKKLQQTITKVNCLTEFDMNTIPELEEFYS